MRKGIFCAFLLLAFIPRVQAKDKSKASLPAYVLQARTVRVVIRPEAGEPLTNPTANSTARENVERALTAWGRLQVVMDGMESDLVIAVRTGSRPGPTIRGGPLDTRPGVMQPGDGGIRIGAQQGRPPFGDSTNGPLSGPRIGNEIGPSDDMFEVYLGMTDYPLDSAPAWRYISKDCLRAPSVPAVEQFRKAIAEAEKAAQEKAQQKKKKP